MNFSKISLPLFIAGLAQNIFGYDLNLNHYDTERKEGLALQAISTTAPLPADYIVGPGDYFEITADNQNFLVQVNPEGYATLNRVGGVKVADLKLDQAREKLLSALSKRFDRSKCFVTLNRQRLQSIGVFGAVNTPAYFELPASIKASNALLYANGLKNSAQADSILIIHKSGDTSILNLVDIKVKGKVANDPLLKLGDVLFVPKVDLSKPTISLLSNGNATPYNLRPNYTIADYLDLSGTLNDLNAYAGVYWAGAKERKYISFADAANFKPAAGDTLDIIQSYGDIYVGGMVQKSGPTPYIPQNRPLDYIAKAGTSVMADQIHRIRVVRKGGKFEYIDPIKGQLYPGDYIELDMSAIDYANRWLPLFSTALGAASLIWGIYYATVWVPNHTK